MGKTRELNLILTEVCRDDGISTAIKILRNVVNSSRDHVDLADLLATLQGAQDIAQGIDSDFTEIQKMKERYGLAEYEKQTAENKRKASNWNFERGERS